MKHLFNTYYEPIKSLWNAHLIETNDAIHPASVNLSIDTSAGFRWPSDPDFFVYVQKISRDVMLNSGIFGFFIPQIIELLKSVHDRIAWSNFSVRRSLIRLNSRRSQNKISHGIHSTSSPNNRPRYSFRKGWFHILAVKCVGGTSLKILIICILSMSDNVDVTKKLIASSRFWWHHLLTLIWPEERWKS